MKTYRDLVVWQINQKCMTLVVDLESLLPDNYAVRHIWRQLFRAIASIGANLAEGQESYEGREFTRYINIAIRSAIEVDHWIASLKNLLKESCTGLDTLEATNLEVIKMLKGLLKSIETLRNK